MEKFFTPQNNSRILNAIRMIVHDTYTARDVFQNTAIKILTKLEKGEYFEEGKFIEWATTVAYNTAIDHFRQVKRTSIDDYYRMDMIGNVPETKTIKEEASDKEHNRDILKHMIDALTPEQKEVVIMRHYCNYSFQKISELLKCSRSTCIGRMRYALINLRKMGELSEINK